MITQDGVTYYESGDIVLITKELFDSLPDDPNDAPEPETVAVRGHETYIYLEDLLKEQEKPVLSREEYRKANAKRTIIWAYGDELEVAFPIRVKIKEKRILHDDVHLVAEWIDAPNESWNECNTHVLEALGFNFAVPMIEVIPIEKADDYMLTDENAVIKHMILATGKKEDEVRNYLKPVFEAMNKSGAVFYRP